MNSKTTTQIVVLTAMLILHSHAWSLEALGIAGYALEYGDNTTRTATNEVEELVHRPNFSLKAEHDVDALEATADYRLIRRTYEKSKFQDETILEGEGQLKWQFLGDLFLVDLQNSRSQRTLDASQQNTADNRQVVDKSSIDAMINLEGFSNHVITGGAGFETLNADESDTDSDRETFFISYIMPQPNNGRIGLLLSHTYTDFDSEASSDYTAESASFQYFKPGNLLLDASLGLTKIDRSMGRNDFSQGTGRLFTNLQLDQSNSLSLEIVRGVDDNTISANVFSSGTFRDEIVDNSGTNEIFVDSRATAAYAGQLGRHEVDFGLFRSKVDYEDSALDENRSGVNLRVNRRLSSRLQANLAVAYTEFDFKDSDRKDKGTDIEIGLEYQANRKLQIGFFLGEYSRDSDDVLEPDISGRSAILTINYTVFGDNISR